MSGESDLKSTTCPKCRNKNPSEAAFCGFCGADLRSRMVSEKATMFGYVADMRPPTPSSSEPSPAMQPASAPAGSDRAPVAPDPDDTAATTAFQAGEGYVGGRYWLQQKARTTPVGEFYAARDSKAEQTVEVLLIGNETFPSPLDMERTRRELRQLQKVNNKHLIRVLDHGKHDDGRLYVVSEFVDGSPLDDLVGRGPFDLARTKDMVMGIGAGLSAAQTVGIVHRDIAPQNVLVTADGKPKVRAIGAAPRIKDHLYGTPEFVSPEQAAGRPVDQRSNIYSMGALMYYMLTGSPPFGGELEQVLEQHKDAEPRPLAASGVALPGSDRVQQLLDKALSKNSSRRHLTLRQFLREVDALSVDATPAPSPSVSGKSAVQTPAAPPAPSSPAHSPASLAETMIGGAPLSLGNDSATSEPAAPSEPPAVSKPTTPSAADAAAEPAASSTPPAASEPKPPSAANAAAVPAAPPSPPAASEPAAPSSPGPTPQPVVVTEDGTLAHPDDDAVDKLPQQTQPPMERRDQELANTVPPIADSPTPGVAEHPTDGGNAAASEPSAPQPPAAEPAEGEAVSAAAAHTVAGEMSGGERVQLRQTSEQPSVKAPDVGTASSAAPPARRSGADGKGFRETMWFFKGEVESAMAEKGEAPSPAEEEGAQDDLAEKYADDGSIDDDAARRLSLRTGRTQMMQAVKVPSGHVPGDKMKAEEFIGEINPGRKVALIALAVVAAFAVGLTIWLLAT
jgi:serine/threonine protein kinase